MTCGLELLKLFYILVFLLIFNLPFVFFVPSFPVCCIYHKTHPVGESSDESDSSSNSDSDDEDRARPTHNHGHDDDNACNHRHHGQAKRRNPRDVSPNAYERQPRYKSEYGCFFLCV